MSKLKGKKIFTILCSKILFILIPVIMIMKQMFEPVPEIMVQLNSRGFCCPLITFENSLDLDQDQQNVCPDLVLQNLSTLASLSSSAGWFASC